MSTYLSRDMPTACAVVDISSTDVTFSVPTAITVIAAGTIVVTPYDGGTDVTFAVIAAPYTLPFAVRKVVKSGTTLTTVNQMFASRLA